MCKSTDFWDYVQDATADTLTKPKQVILLFRAAIRRQTALPFSAKQVVLRKKAWVFLADGVIKGYE